MPYETTMCRPNERLQVRETKQTIKVLYPFVYQRASGQNHINSAQQHESRFFHQNWIFRNLDFPVSRYHAHLSSINTSTTTPKHAVLPCPLRALPCLLRFGVFCQRTLQVCKTKWDYTGQWRFVFTCFKNCSVYIRHIWHLRVLCIYTCICIQYQAFFCSQICSVHMPILWDVPHPGSCENSL